MSTPTLKPVTFVLGVPRSGTTLLRLMLGGHPRLFSPPEMVIAPFETMAQRKAKLEERFWEKGGLRRAFMALRGYDVDAAKAEVAALVDKTIPEVYRLLQELIGERELVDKCPHLCATPEALPRLAQWFPQARYLWIVRHPGSIIRSIQNMPMAEVMLQGYADDPKQIWRLANGVLESFLDSVPRERWMRVKYEDLVTDAEPVMQSVCKLLGLPFDAALLDPYEGDRMREGPKGARAIGDPNLAGRGKVDPSLASKWLEGFDPRTVDEETRSYARKLGYDLDGMELPPIAAVSDEVRALFDAAIKLEADIDLPMDIDAVEGRRFLLRMLSASIDTFTEHGDVDRPRFHHAEGPTRKMFADCPDTDYLRAPIRTTDGRVYRVSGRVPPGTLYAGFLLYGKGGRIGNRLRDDDLKLDADGRFELRIGTEEQSGNWLKADGDETAFLVRQYFADRAAEPALEVDIEREGELPPHPPLAAESFATSVHKAQRMLTSVFKRTTQAQGMASGMALNKFIEIPGDQLFPTPDNRYHVCWYRFGYDQVMFLRGRLPKARYFSLSLCNAWLESLDYERHTVSLNHAQIRTDTDGSFEVALAHSDPGHPNWLDTTGHHAGFIVVRELLPDGEPPSFDIQVMYDKEWQEKRDA